VPQSFESSDKRAGLVARPRDDHLHLAGRAPRPTGQRLNIGGPPWGDVNPPSGTLARSDAPV
jgi:hypothetical protein